MNYLEKLASAAENRNSIVCMGLDPDMNAIPSTIPYVTGKIVTFFYTIFDEMEKEKVFPGAFKPNHGFYEKFDKPREGKFWGSETLAMLIKELESRFPDIPIILDFKRGDIAKSSENYAIVGFDNWHASAVTVAPYMGSDSVNPFTKYCKNDKGVYVLNRTSNPGGKDLQNLCIMKDNTPVPLYKAVGEKIIEWAQDAPGTGAVVGATNIAELEDLANLYAGKRIPLLIPGVGGQGGSASEVMEKLRNAGYELELVRINSSSGITHPWKVADKAPADYAKVCVSELKKLNDEIAYRKTT